MMRKLTKEEKLDNKVWDALYENKLISKLDIASMLCDVMDKLKLPSLDRTGLYSYQKTKEWAEVCESTKRFFLRIVENSTGSFLDREFKRARDCRKKKKR
jgi:hypothetical protein